MTKTNTIEWIKIQVEKLDKDSLEKIADFIYFEIYDNEKIQTLRSDKN